MKKMKDSNEDEMILEFLKGEISSTRFSSKLKDTLIKLGYQDELILNGNLFDKSENEKRKKIMSKFRGYPNEELFKNFPSIDNWEFVKFNEEDLNNIYYINYDYWNELSNHTSKPKEAAKVISSGKEIYGVSNEPFLKGLEVGENNSFPPVILITCNNQKFLIIEGHSRMTIYGMKPEMFDGAYGFIGHCTEAEMHKYDPRMTMLNDNLVK